METRKVQLSGGTTYTVSLPKFWAEDHGVEAGSVLHLSPNDDGSLLVEAADRADEDGEIKTVEVDGMDDSALRETVQALYLIGADEVCLVSRSGDVTNRERVFWNIVSELTGFEILESGPDEVTMRSLMDASNVSIPKSTIRLRLIADAMHEDAVEAVRENDADLAESVVERDPEADKLFRLVTRHFQRTLTDLAEVEKLSMTRPEMFAFYYLARQLERVADHAERMAEVAREQSHAPDESLGSEMAAIGRDARSLIWQATEPLLSDTDVSVAYDALDRRESVAESIETLDRALYQGDHEPEAYHWGLLLDSLERSADYGANIAELAVQQTTADTADRRCLEPDLDSG